MTFGQAFRFYGLSKSLNEWRGVLEEKGISTTNIYVKKSKYGDVLHFGAVLNEEQREELQILWRAGWNQRITYKKVKI